MKAQPGESLESLSQRSDNAWDQGRTVAANGIDWRHQIDGGELVKVAGSEPYTTPSR